ncbi:MAG: carbohydrate binding family 9 domain-containing protein [Candidatus Cloacimonetes bacterium]|nr:carbohydrate binding family 9 domain-containing protein [Candidatus Cloacimonadota bacterium]
MGTKKLVIDGKIDDEIWNKVEWSGDFVQRTPYENEKPSQETKLKILYDDKNIYFGFRAYDTDPSKITSITAPRDWFPGDWVEVNIDSYFDKRSAFSFTLSVSGVRGDEFISDDGDNWDTSWNPIWFAKTNIDEQGWTAEMRIPLNQLRYSDIEEQVWGIEVTRRIHREEERSVWQLITQDEPGWVSNFGELRGIKGIKPQRHIELLPYLVGKLERFEADENNPFNDGSSENFNVGLDGKIGITTDLTLDLTINPDFGQVEADPSEINLTEFETYFSEKRPFFIEGNNILDYKLTSAITGGDFVSDNLFYSRRIGRKPRYYPDNYDYLDIPENSTILGAFKLSGKTKKGWSVGIMESVTEKELAEYELDEQKEKITVEPLTNYFVSRVMKDFNKGKSCLGGMFTSVNRKIDDAHLNYLNKAAYSGGIDFLRQWKDKTYYLMATTAFSQIQGDKEAILEAQTCSARYFQRPDNKYASVDSNRTSLSGTAGSVIFGKSSSSRIKYQTGVSWRSPGFEINDIGYLRRADQINQFTWLGYWINQPFGIFRKFSVNANQWCNWDFGGINTSNSVNLNVHGTFKNSSNFGGGITRSFEYISNEILRGGPSAKRPGDWNGNFNFNSDGRKRINFSCGTNFGVGDNDNNSFNSFNSYWINLRFRPNNQLRVSLNPSYNKYEQNLEYVATAEFEEEDRFIFSSLFQETTSLTFRVDYCITPNFSIQYYGSPFISAGKYSDFKRITDPKAENYDDRFYQYSEEEIDYDTDNEEYLVDENLDGTPDYYIYNPDFNYKAFNSNLVIRWEFSPGSNLYLVWSQNRSDYISDGVFSYYNDMKTLFYDHPHNVFLIKVNHWFSL